MKPGKEIIPGTAFWAWHPERKEHEAGFTLFRRTVDCASDSPFGLAVSADNRFNFYLDGKLLGRGPQRSDLDHYYFDEYHGTLAAGRHVFAAEVVVWRNAWRRSPGPWAEMHAGGGVMVAGYAGQERMELPEHWLCRIDFSRRPLAWKEAWGNATRIPAPPMDEVDFARGEPGWLTDDAPQGNWVEPVILGRAEFRGYYQNDPDTPWNLMPRPLKQMTESFTPIAAILESTAKLKLAGGRLAGRLPAGRHKILLDLGRNQTSMVYFSGRGGTGTCRMAYSETLFDPEGIKICRYPGSLGRQGLADVLKFAGKPWRYASFWYRTGRYIELDMDLASPVEELDLAFHFITYPLGEYREFHAPGDPALEKIYQVACHTLSCCAHEHFEDCPYYEQLQYAGDSRIEALVSYAVSGKDDLGRNMLKTIAFSQLPNGLTQSRYPSVFQQVIPEYSLIWVLALHDHYVCFQDPDLVRELMPCADSLLRAFERRRRPDGLLDDFPGTWHYSDWVPGWKTGAPDRGEDVPSTLLNLFYIEACRRAADLKELLGEDAAPLRKQAEKTADAVNRLCFDPALNRYLDAPGHPEWLSMHPNVLAVLFGLIPEEKRAAFLREVCGDERLSKMSLYFSFYLLAAVRLYGTREELRCRYAPWEKMLELGCTTFPEIASMNCRSVCHAWSCAPAWFLMRDSGALHLCNSIYKSI